MSLYDEYVKKTKPKSDGLHDIEGLWSCPKCLSVGEGKYNNKKGVVVGFCDEHPDAEIFIGAGRA